jgi:hypothetical protein
MCNYKIYIIVLMLVLSCNKTSDLSSRESTGNSSEENSNSINNVNDLHLFYFSAIDNKLYLASDYTAMCKDFFHAVIIKPTLWQITLPIEKETRIATVIIKGKHNFLYTAGANPKDTRACPGYECGDVVQAINSCHDIDSGTKQAVLIFEDAYAKCRKSDQSNVCETETSKIGEKVYSTKHCGQNGDLFGGEPIYRNVCVGN